MTAICVDDEKLLADHVTKLCAGLPMISEAISFSNPYTALDWMQSHSADLALLDIDMPDMNGLKLAAQIKHLQPDCSVIFLTAFADYMPGAWRLHASGFLLKPLDESALHRELNALRYPVRGLMQ